MMVRLKLRKPIKKDNKEKVITYTCKDCENAYNPHEKGAYGYYFLVNCKHKKYSKFIDDKPCELFTLRKEQLDLSPKEINKDNFLDFLK